MLIRAMDEFAKMATIPEHDVAYDDETPAIAEHLQRQVNRAAGFLRVLQSTHSVYPLAL